MNKIVLLVDDDSLARTSLATVLEDRGEITVLQAGNGKEALGIAVSQKPHLIVTDVHMPEMDGLTMIKQLRANEDTKVIPVIVLTIDEAPVTLNEALAAGVTVYLSKASADPQVIADQIVTAIS